MSQESSKPIGEAAVEITAPDENARQRLLKAAVELFDRKGYAATSVSEIVSAAGVTKPVLYYYFRNKEGIFLELANKGIARLQEILNRQPGASGSTARERILRLSLDMFSFIQEQLPMIRVMQSILYGPPQGAPQVDFECTHNLVRDTFTRLVEEGIASGEFVDGNAEDMVVALMGVHEVYMESQLCHPDRAIGLDTVVRVLDIIFRGMSPAGRTGALRVEEARS